MTDAVDYVTMREEWLMNAVEGMRATFEARTGLTIPTVRIGVGFLTGGVRSSAGGQCFKRALSADGVNEIIVLVTVCDPVTVLSILGHELIHAALDNADGHTKKFLAAFKAMGYTGTAKSHAVTDQLQTDYETLSAALGAYPGDEGLAFEMKKRKQTTRMVGLACPACQYIVRTTRKWIAISLPKCGSDGDTMTEEEFLRIQNERATRGYDV